MISAPDVVGNSVSRARQRLEEAGIAVAALRPVKPPPEWRPAVAHNFDVEPYVVCVHPDQEGRNVVLDVVVAWKPREGKDAKDQHKGTKKRSSR